MYIIPIHYWHKFWTHDLYDIYIRIHRTGAAYLHNYYHAVVKPKINLDVTFHKRLTGLKLSGREPGRARRVYTTVYTFVVSYPMICRLIHILHEPTAELQCIYNQTSGFQLCNGRTYTHTRCTYTYAYRIIVGPIRSWFCAGRKAGPTKREFRVSKSGVGRKLINID